MFKVKDVLELINHDKFKIYTKGNGIKEKIILKLEEVPFEYLSEKILNLEVEVVLFDYDIEENAVTENELKWTGYLLIVVKNWIEE